jgi:superfamily II DNA or RNA helicase
VAVGVEFGGDLQPEAAQVVADPRPVLRMSWERETLQIEARVAPLGLDAIWLRPGVGNPALTAERIEDGVARLVACERDLADEARRLAQIERECPTLACFGGGAGRWSLPRLQDALEALLELGRLGDEVVFAWPAGKPLHPPIERELGDLSVNVRTAGAWLELDVAVLVDEGKVLRLRELIDAREGRFVALGEGRFLALSAALQRRLDALARLDVGTGAAQRLEVSPAMLPVLAELTEELAGASFDTQTRRSLARLRELSQGRPPLLRGFEARLRNYQEEGYAWMWRLAEAGLGACLADDMGHGKTVQTLALLCQRARRGPALVVCPISVVHNWVAEAKRFAPSLRVAVLANADDRSALLGAAARRDVIVCSYGLLVSEQQALAEVAFATAVFDEAHALKNAKTARAKAARAIQAEFRLGLTGTPVENRVTELWSLFRVLVPGLLGTRARFDERFAKPIARGEREAAASLRAVLRHFILRRTKAGVLDELPPRTEVTLLIPAPPDARDYYEALRRRALAAVEDGDARSKRVRVLAELTRLRQAAVDPRLLDDQAPAGAKIDALVEQVAALREQGHRALVFTQFLTSMALLRAGFEAAGVETLELDGSTSAAERARRVEAFQAGEADVFVLSLRAGGVGMNLTGADYVFHLDPWWNPAVEDQATDRAHRIGQTRPVTVYRLIGEGTVEAKILELHASKRNLAGDILAGLEGSEGLDLDELMSLLEA